MLIPLSKFARKEGKKTEQALSQCSALKVEGMFAAAFCVVCVTDGGQDQTLRKLQVPCNAQGKVCNTIKMFSCSMGWLRGTNLTKGGVPKKQDWKRLGWPVT